MGTTSLKSASGAVRIRVLSEPKYSTDQVRYFRIELTDADGVVWANRDTQLTVTVEGGQLLGFGSAQPCTEECYQSGTFTTYYGQAQAIVKSDDGKAKLTVSGEGLTPVSVKL